MTEHVLSTVSEVVDALGGTAATAKLCGRVNGAVSNWKSDGTFPDRASIERTIAEALKSKGLSADPRLFGKGAA